VRQAVAATGFERAGLRHQTDVRDRVGIARAPGEARPDGDVHGIRRSRGRARAIGLFGVVAHDVASRKVELALRVALGADRMRIMRATFGQGAAIVAPALALGALLSVWAARVSEGRGIRSDRLDDVEHRRTRRSADRHGTRCHVPAARRAARTDPLLALRGE
jgi:hypothetical protein